MEQDKQKKNNFYFILGLGLLLIFILIGLLDKPSLYVFNDNWEPFGDNNISFNGTATIYGNLTVTDTITTNNLELNNSLNISEFNLSADNGFFNNLFVTNNMTIYGSILNVTTLNVNVTGNITATGTVNASDIFANNIYAYDSIDFDLLSNNGSFNRANMLVDLVRVNETGGIGKCKVVYINGVTGDKPQVGLADNTIHAKAHVFGLSLDAGADGELIRVQTFGELRDCDTSNLTTGLLHLITNGNVQNAIPTSGAHVHVGWATKINVNSGLIEIEPDQYMHDIRATTDTDVELAVGSNDASRKISFQNYDADELGYMDGSGYFSWGGNMSVIDLITENLNVSNDLWVKNTLGDWVYLPRHLETSVRFYNNLLLSELNCSMNGSVLTFYDANNESLIHNIGANETILDVKNGTFTLIEGTDSSPIENYVYYDTPGSDNIVVSVSEPTIDNAIIAKVLFGANYSYASLIDRTSPDTALTDIYDRFFDEGVLYISGFTPNATSNNVTITGGGIMKIIIDEHIHQGNFSLSDGYFFVLDNGTYVRSTDINDILQYGDGGLISGSRYFNIVWSLIHNDAQQVRLLATIQNEPPVEFATLDDAEADNRYTVFFETQNNLDKYGMPILRTVVRRLAGVNTIQQVNSGEYFLDVRGTTKATGAGGASPPITNHNELNKKEWSLAGHTMDDTLDMNNNDIIDIFYLQSTTFNNTGNATISGTLDMNNNAIHSIFQVNTTNLDISNILFTDSLITRLDGGDLTIYNSAFSPIVDFKNDSNVHFYNGINATGNLTVSDSILGGELSGNDLILLSNPNYNGLISLGYVSKDIITNGDFTGSSTSWSTSGNFAYSDNSMKATNAVNGNYFQQTSANMKEPLIAGGKYIIIYTQNNLSKSVAVYPKYNRLDAECGGEEFRVGHSINDTYYAVFTTTNTNPCRFTVQENDAYYYNATFDDIQLRRIDSQNSYVTGNITFLHSTPHIIAGSNQQCGLIVESHSKLQTAPPLCFRSSSQFGDSTGELKYDGSNEFWDFAQIISNTIGFRMGGAGAGIYNLLNYFQGVPIISFSGGNAYNLSFNTKSDNSKGVYIPYGNLYINRDNGGIKYGNESNAYQYWDGTNFITDTNYSGDDGIAWFSNNISATGYITRTEVWDENSSRAIDNLKSSNELLNLDGSINHSAFSESVTYKVKDLNNCSLVVVDYEYCGIYGYYNKTLNTTIYETEETCKPINDFPKYINSTKRPIYENVCEEKIEHGVNLGLMTAKHEQALATYREATDVLELDNLSSPSLKTNSIITEQIYTQSKTIKDNTSYINKIKDKDKLKNKTNHPSYVQTLSKDGVPYHLLDMEDRIVTLEGATNELFTILCNKNILKKEDGCN